MRKHFGAVQIRIVLFLTAQVRAEAALSIALACVAARRALARENRPDLRSVPRVVTARGRRVTGVDVLRVPAALHDGTREDGGEVGLELPLGAGRIRRPWRRLPAGEAPGRGARLAVDLLQLRARGAAREPWRGAGWARAVGEARRECVVRDAAWAVRRVGLDGKGAPASD